MIKKFIAGLSLKIKVIVAIVLAAVLAISVVLSAGAISSCVSDKIDSRPVDYKWKGVKAEEVTDGYEKGSSKVTQTSEYLGEVERVKPVEGIKDEHEKWGVDTYPSYGKNLGSLPSEKFFAIINECRDLIPGHTWHSSKTYYYIDKDGYLLDNKGARIPYSLEAGSGGGTETGGGESDDDGVISEGFEDDDEAESGNATASSQFNAEYRMLYTHTTASTMYGGGLSDDEPRIKKTITCISRAGGHGSKHITGLYAPGGEVIKIQMSEEDFTEANGVNVYIGQNYNIEAQDGVSLEWSVSNGIAKAKGGSGFTRMPNILSHFSFAVNTASPVVTHENGVVTFYVGSFWGGPIYFRPNSNGSQHNISITISGGVKYQHFILGATTEEEYSLNKNSTAPYFDLEVYDSAIRFTTGKAGAASLSNMTYENCTDAAVLWDKITQVSKKVGPNGLTSANVPINFIGDVYIAAGAAYANPGRNGVVCPPSWVASALNYNSFVNTGDWGSMHEYNHCWQGYGLNFNGEVTNNATTLVSYSLYTKISASRTSDTGWGNGGWNRFTDPSKALADLLTQSNSGTEEEPQKCFDLPLYATLLHNIGQENYIESAHSGIYYKNLVEATHTDMTYYFTDILNQDIGEADSNAGTLSQATIDEVKAKKYPVFVPVASVYQVGRSLTYQNEKGKKEKTYITTAQPYTYGFGEFIMDFNNQNDFKNGSFVSKSLVIPDGFTVTVAGVTQPENGKVKVLKNNQVQYTPKNGKDGLYSGEFTVKLKITKNDKAFKVDDVELVINLKQSNYIDRTTYVYDDESKVPDTEAVYDAKKKSFNFGKYESTETIPNVCTQETNTQIWQSGWNYYDKVYDSKSENYKVMPANQTLQTMEGVLYFSNAQNTYRFTLKGRGKSTLYLSFDGGKSWEQALTINRSSGNQYINDEYYEMTAEDAENLVNTGGSVYFKVVHLVMQENNFFAVGVASKKADGSYTGFSNASAYRNEVVLEDATQKFTTDYRYKNEYKYSYKKTANLGSLVSINYEPWDATLKAENLFDGNSNTYFHSKGSNDGSTYITEEKPLELIGDLGEVCAVNAVTFTGYKGGAGNNGMLKSFKLYGSKDGNKYSLLTEQTDMKEADTDRVITLSFDEAEIRYYKLVVTKTDNERYFAMNNISFSVSLPDGKVVAPNDFSVRYEKAKKSEGWSTENVLCNFGLIYTANEKDYAEFHFTGTRFAYFAYQSADYGTVDIYVDGKKVASDVSLSADKNVGSLAYIYTGNALKNGDHVVKIVGKTGKFNVDSFVYWE